MGLLLVGWGGNNGSTITAALEANRRNLSWRTRNGVQTANWFGSITQSSTVLLGSDEQGNDVFAPMNKLVPMVQPEDIGKRTILHYSGMSYKSIFLNYSHWRLGYKLDDHR